jgi:hypothetical protein
MGAQMGGETREASPAADWLRAERVMSWNGQSEASDATTGGSCTTTKAFVPPTPSEFTPARRGPIRRGQSVSLSFTPEGAALEINRGFGTSKLKLGGIWPAARASS